MVYLAELLVVMTDGRKIVRICARNVPRTRTQALIDDDAFLASLSLTGKQQCCVYSMRRGAILLKHKNLAIANRSRVICAYNTLRASIGINITP